MVEKGLVQDPTLFILYAVKEGLDVAMYIDRERAAYDTVVRNILLLFGDGEKNQMIIAVPHEAAPDLQLRVLEAFMAAPLMGRASPQIRNDFKAYRDFLIQQSGMVLPEAVPNPDDIALLTQPELAIQGGGGVGSPQQTLGPPNPAGPAFR